MIREIWREAVALSRQCLCQPSHIQANVLCGIYARSLSTSIGQTCTQRRRQAPEAGAIIAYGKCTATVSAKAQIYTRTGRCKALAADKHEECTMRATSFLTACVARSQVHSRSSPDGATRRSLFFPHWRLLQGGCWRSQYTPCDSEGRQSQEPMMPLGMVHPRWCLRRSGRATSLSSVPWGFWLHGLI